ncbi:helix-turn-helix domain-containing protein [Ferrovibrio sp.]|uniref:helix-turn-helix domain-containing protein n=1 Tax=Ferrovibrio sp. TaxID=1917215 RepID=UPI0035B481EC
MKLVEWLKRNGKKPEAIAAVIGLSQPGISRVLSGQRIPRPETMARIVLATGGQVQPNDFYAEHIAKARARLMAGASRRALRAGREA